MPELQFSGDSESGADFREELVKNTYHTYSLRINVRYILCIQLQYTHMRHSTPHYSTAMKGHRDRLPNHVYAYIHSFILCVHVKHVSVAESMGSRVLALGATILL